MRGPRRPSPRARAQVRGKDKLVIAPNHDERTSKESMHYALIALTNQVRPPTPPQDRAGTGRREHVEYWAAFLGAFPRGSR